MQFYQCVSSQKKQVLVITTQNLDGAQKLDDNTITAVKDVGNDISELLVTG